MKPGELFSFYNKATTFCLRCSWCVKWWSLNMFWRLQSHAKYQFDFHIGHVFSVRQMQDEWFDLRSRGPPEVWCPVHPRGLRGDLRGSSTSVARPRTSGWCHPTVHQKRGFDTLSPIFLEKLPCHILYILYIFPILIPALGRSLSIFEYPEMEESLTAWTTFLAEDVSNYAKGGRWGWIKGWVKESSKGP